MAAAELISPNFIERWQQEGFLPKGVISCERWSWTNYTVEEYKILYEHKKLAYFFFISDDEKIEETPFLCHGCLFNELKKAAGNEPLRVTLLDEENSYSCELIPEEWMDGDPYPEPEESDEDDDEDFWFPKE